MKALVLLSGGVDSTTCLGIAAEEYGRSNVSALCIVYGQKHTKEIECAKAVAEYYDIPLYIKDVSTAFDLSKCSLLQGREEMVHKSYAEQLAEMGGSGTVSTYVPFRNGLFLSMAAAVAISLECGVIYYGAHSDDATGGAYPDCTPEFETAMKEAIYLGSGQMVSMKAPLIDMNKGDVVMKGLAIKVPYELTWSCYEGKERQCGTCGTCIDRKKAFLSNGIKDPVGYFK